MNKIITGIDSRKRCAAALRAAAQLSTQLDTRLEVVHAVDVPRPFWPGIDSLKLASINASALAEAWKRELEFLRSELSSDHGPSLESMLHVHPGKPAQVLCRHAEEANADLLVLGDHQERDLLDFGSTLRSCLAKATCPVWFQRTEWSGIRRILVPVDMSGESASALRIAIRIAKGLGSSIRVLHCFSTPTTAVAGGGYYPEIAVPFPTEKIREVTEEEFEKFVAEQDTSGVEVASSFVDSSACEGILEAAKEADLVAMGTHGRTGLARAVLGNIAYSILSRAEVPVLAVPLPRREWLL